ncbi:MAG: metallophosphoesterase, partial [Myxococcota bacterium]|nr:metallophosphoesterase [Myxococcota bacterium]
GSSMPRFLRILLAVTAVIHLPVALGVGELARRLGFRHPWAFGAALALAGFVLFVGRAKAGMPDRRRNAALVRFVDIPYYIHWCAGLWALIPAVVATLLAPVIDWRLPLRVSMWSYLSGLLVCGYGVLVRRRWFRVVEREVLVTGLDPRLDGLRIAHLSDLHIGTLTPKSWGLAWAAAANGRAPDLAVVTGDMVTSGTEYHEDIAEAVGALRAKHGVYASMGNHDYFGEGEPLVSLLRGRGVTVLRNEGTAIEQDGAALWLAAIDDTWTRRDDLARAMRDRPAGATTVLLAHDPLRFDAAADTGVDVVLSGHTHGGQVAMPFAYRAIGLANLAHRYRVGFYRRGRSTLYVHPGLGTTGPPIRLGVAPEVTILLLRRA